MSKLVLKLKFFFKRWYRHILALAFLFLLFLVFEITYRNPTSDSDFKNSLYSDYKVLGVTIPKDLNFCGELVPLSNPVVKQNLEKELFQNTFNQPLTLQMNKKAHRWFPLIESILKKNGVPDDFKYIAIVESGFNNYPDSPTASGFWGLMVPVAKTYGLQINDEVDERFNIERATNAACRIFKEAYKKYNSWTLAAAAYDMGTGALDEQLAKQNSQNYYDLKLNEETARYIYRIIAFKEIISRPDAYGYKLKPKDLYSPIPTYSVKVDSSIADLNAFAVLYHSTYRDLNILNPWLLKSSLQNADHKSYEILFPKPGVKLFGADNNDVPVVSDTTGKNPMIDTAKH